MKPLIRVARLWFLPLLLFLLLNGCIVSYLVGEAVNSLYAGQDPYNVLWQIANGESAPAAAGEFEDPRTGF